MCPAEPSLAGSIGARRAHKLRTNLAPALRAPGGPGAGVALARLCRIDDPLRRSDCSRSRVSARDLRFPRPRRPEPRATQRAIRALAERTCARTPGGARLGR